MKIHRLTLDFFAKPTIEVAKDLLGTFLVHESPQGTTIGRIVETEAYLMNDPACHAHRGQTPRNRTMFGPPGRAYIYFIYGMHYCFNVVTAPIGKGEAVLIRALEPVSGIKLMEKRRTKKSTVKFERTQLCNGPSKLVQAMGLTKKHNGIPLITSPLYFLSRQSFPHSLERAACFSFHTTTRIGIKKGSDLPLRFYLKESTFISKK